MNFILTFIGVSAFSSMVVIGCSSSEGQLTPNITSPNSLISIIDTSGYTIQSRFNLPLGYSRTKASKNSFANYLRTSQLKPSGQPVLFYDGTVKGNKPKIYCAVFDHEIGNRDLHQCADGIMRLRAEFHWNAKEYDSIHFNFTNGFRVDYTNWAKGKRINVNGNKYSWYQSTNSSYSYPVFWKYLEKVFTYAGTLSLSKELKSVSISDMKIGDVFIQGGSPGHAVIVVDMIQNKDTGK